MIIISVNEQMDPKLALLKERWAGAEVFAFDYLNWRLISASDMQQRHSFSQINKFVAMHSAYSEK